MFSINEREGYIDFKSTDAEKRRYGDLPGGTYPFMIVSAEVVEDERGARFELKLQLDDATSDYNGKWIWQKLYFKGGTVKPRAVSIGHERLTELLPMIGAEGFKSISEAESLAKKLESLSLEATVEPAPVGERMFYNISRFFNGRVSESVPF